MPPITLHLPSAWHGQELVQVHGRPSGALPLHEACQNVGGGNVLETKQIIELLVKLWPELV